MAGYTESPPSFGGSDTERKSREFTCERPEKTQTLPRFVINMGKKTMFLAGETHFFACE